MTSDQEAIPSVRRRATRTLAAGRASPHRCPGPGASSSGSFRGGRLPEGFSPARRSRAASDRTAPGPASPTRSGIFPEKVPDPFFKEAPDILAGRARPPRARRVVARSPLQSQRAIAWTSAAEPAARTTFPRTKRRTVRGSAGGHSAPAPRSRRLGWTAAPRTGSPSTSCTAMRAGCTAERARSHAARTNGTSASPASGFRALTRVRVSPKRCLLRRLLASGEKVIFIGSG